ncbi:hypothetical protein [Roseisolibacter agri]|uniref:Uncharacterized protein n=1 Tax=Roseisolibacter agri TaxID=2014610 RepID=A0AA37V9R4_9BACT|nr:hypothetical protein [Roseisolibacter agri]GLC24673.1 hypothetical protein rosag_11860 [Roseisolibacter agri]
MAGGGAVVAIIAAAHAQRVQAVTDAFRLAGATAPERARPLAALGVGHESVVDELARAGVLLRGPGGDTWYLSEAAVVARRDARRNVPRVVLAIIAILVGVAVFLVGTLMRRAQ